MRIGSKLFVRLAALLCIASPPAFAQELERSRDGTVACGGIHAFRLGGNEVTFTAYNFRNFNESTTITIDSITIYDGDGTVLRSMPASDPFPPGFNNILSPRQTAVLTTFHMFGNDPTAAPSTSAFQTIVRWSASARGLALFAHMARQDRGRDPVTGAIQEQRARSLFRCVTIR